MKASITKQVMDLRDKRVEDLREMYESLFNEKPDKSRNSSYLRPRIAYRIQELAYGGLSDETKSRLIKIANGTPPSKLRPCSNLLPGTKLCREYNGVIHEVEVKSNCLEYQGQKFRSLSAIAFKITGTKWNGYKFFKLK